MKLLLDTCTFLWIVSEQSRLSQVATAVFMDEKNERYLSAASSWEIAIKYANGRLSLTERPDILIPRIREASGIEPLGIDEESALHAGKLPGIHSDPFDRMLVAQAIIHGMTILTPDPKIERYGVRVLW